MALVTENKKKDVLKSVIDKIRGKKSLLPFMKKAPIKDVSPLSKIEKKSPSTPLPTLKSNPKGFGKILREEAERRASQNIQSRVPDNIW